MLAGVRVLMVVRQKHHPEDLKQAHSPKEWQEGGHILPSNIQSWVLKQAVWEGFTLRAEHAGM